VGMTHLTKIQDTKTQLKQDAPDIELHIDARYLVKRINKLVIHIDNLDGAKEAEKSAREMSTHIKNIKEIMALNESLKQLQNQEKQDYTLEEEQALAEELAEIIIKNGRFP
jgi:ribonuclease HI